MPDLDRFLDTLVSDVAAGTRAPGPLAAIRQARRRRAMGAASAVAAVVIIAVGGTLAGGNLGGRSDPSPIGVPTTPSSESPTAQQSAGPPTSPDAFGTELDAILEHVSGWAVTKDRPLPDHYDYAFNGPCAGNWGKRASGGSDGGAPGTSADGMGTYGFSSAARASDAAARFVANLASCGKTAWRTQPIARTGAVLASSPDAVAWIQRIGDRVVVLQVRTTDGPPPEGVQAQVAEWMVAYRAWMARNH